MAVNRGYRIRGGLIRIGIEAEQGLPEIPPERPDRPTPPAGLLADPGEDPDPGETARRLAICESCPDRDGRWCGRFLRPSRGRTCGCFLPLKARLRWFHCPQGKW